MEKEFIPIGGYVPLGGIRAYCVSIEHIENDDFCTLCAFEGTGRCKTLPCMAQQREDGKDVLFTIKLNSKRYDKKDF